jgi:hypothetical protein
MNVSGQMDPSSILRMIYPQPFQFGKDCHIFLCIVGVMMHFEALEISLSNT